MGAQKVRDRLMMKCAVTLRQTWKMYKKYVLPAEKKKQPGHGAVINSLTAVCSGYFHLTAGYLESAQCFALWHLNQSYFSVPYGIPVQFFFHG